MAEQGPDLFLQHLMERGKYQELPKRKFTHYSVNFCICERPALNELSECGHCWKTCRRSVVSDAVGERIVRTLHDPHVFKEDKPFEREMKEKEKWKLLRKEKENKMLWESKYTRGRKKRENRILAATEKLGCTCCCECCNEICFLQKKK